MAVTMNTAVQIRHHSQKRVNSSLYIFWPKRYIIFVLESVFMTFHRLTLNHTRLTCEGRFNVSNERGIKIEETLGIV